MEPRIGRPWRNVCWFQIPHVPLKVLRGEQDQVDIQDQYYERFQAPGTTTEDAEDDKDIDDDSRRSSLSHEGITTDIGQVSEESMARCLGSSLNTENNPPNAPEHPPNTPEYPPNAPEYPPNAPTSPPNAPESPPNAPEYPPNAPEYPPNAPEYPPNAPEYPPNAPEYPPNAPEYPPDAPEYDTTGSINLEAEDVQAAVQVHHQPNSDVTSNDDREPLLTNMHWLW